MGGNGSDSSGGPARIRRIKVKPARQAKRKSFESALKFALDGGSSSDDGPSQIVGGPRPSPAKGASDFLASLRAADAAPAEPASDFVVHTEVKPRKKAAPKPRLTGTAGPTLGEERAKKHQPDYTGKTPSQIEEAEILAALKKHERKNPTNAEKQKIQWERKKHGPRSRVVGDGQEQSSSEEGEGRFRERKGLIGVKGSGGRAGGQRQQEESDEEAAEPEEDKVAAWKEELHKRADAGAQDDSFHDLRTAFSIKQCSSAAVRRLGPESFLGGCRLAEGGRPLYDDEGKVNLHFLLGTYRAVLAQISKRKKGDKTVEAINPDTHSYLRWLVRQARELVLINREEMKKGYIPSKRMDAVKKTGKFSLLLEANLADAAGDDIAEAPALIDVKFPERINVTQRDGAQGRFRSHIACRQETITVASSHNVDLEKVQNLLTAPTLSFDWEARDDDDDIQGLEVDMPEAEQPQSKRDIFRDQLRRSVSFKQAKNLAKSVSNLSRGDSSQSLASGELAPKTNAEKDLGGTKQKDAQANGASADNVEGLTHDEINSLLEDDSMPSLDEINSYLEEDCVNQNEEPASGSKAEPNGGVSDFVDQETAASDVASTTATVAVGGVPSSSDISMLAPDTASIPAPLPQTIHGAPAPSSAPPVPILEEAAVEGDGVRAIAPVVEPNAGLAPDSAATLEWPEGIKSTGSWPEDISPTAMWGGCTSPQKIPMEQVPMDLPCAQAAGISPTVPFAALDIPGCIDEHKGCISPTAPFVQDEAQRAAISPTAPFVAETEHRVVSPTAPFVADGEHHVDHRAAISPTAPFVLDAAAPALKVPEISQTAPFVMPSALAEQIAADMDLSLDAATAGAAVLQEGGTTERRDHGIKRAASLMPEDDSDGSGGEMDLGNLLDQDMEDELGPPSERDKRKMQQQREWARHKRRALKKGAQGRSVAIRGGEEDEDNAALFGGGFAKGVQMQKRPSFLKLGSGALGKSGA